MTNLGSTFLAPLAAESHVPRLVWYSPAGRTELSTASLTNWSAKVAGLLRDELGLGPGDSTTLTASSWLSVPILLGTWWAGLGVQTSDDPAASESVAVAFVAPEQDASADEVFVVSNHPLALAVPGIAAHQRDFTSAVLGQADRFGGAPEVAASSAAFDNQDIADVLRRTTPAAGSTSPVVLARQFTPDLLAAYRAGGSLVIVTDPSADVTAIAAAERVT